jgi:hypothetical protein
VTPLFTLDRPQQPRITTRVASPRKRLVQTSFPGVEKNLDWIEIALARSDLADLGAAKMFPPFSTVLNPPFLISAIQIRDRLRLSWRCCHMRDPLPASKHIQEFATWLSVFTAHILSSFNACETRPGFCLAWQPSPPRRISTGNDNIGGELTLAE